MANFGKLTITNKGLEEQYKAQNGTQLKFKRIGMGSGNFSGNIMSLTKLVAEKVSVDVQKGYMQNGAYVIEGFFNNEGLNTGFEWREIGLFCEDERGNEILYCYANAGDDYDYIPATEDERYTKYIRIATIIGNAQNVSIVENTGITYVDTLTFIEAEAKIDISSSASGNVITLTDSTDAPFSQIKMFGKTEQVKTNGYQLFDASKLATTTKGGATIKNNGDGSFTISGSGALTDVCSVEYEISNEEAKKLFRAGTLRLKTEYKTYPMCFVNLYKNGNFSQTILSSNWGTDVTANLLEEYFEGETYNFRIGFHGNANTDIAIGTIKPMLFQDGDGIWEFFSDGKVSPCPIYPQDIHSIGDSGSTKIKIYGKNILKNLEKTQTFNGITYTPNSDGTITVNGTATSSAALVLEYKNAIVGEYILTGSTANTRVVARVVNKDGTSAYHTSYNGSEIKFKVTEDTREYNVYCEVKGDVTVNGEVIKPMLRIAGDNTYVPYTETNVSIPLANPLHGIPVNSGGNYTDEDGQQWICDEIDLARGVYIQRTIQKNYNGDEGWTKASSSAEQWGYYIAVNDGKRGNIICDRLQNNNSDARIYMSTTGGGKTAIVVELKGYMTENTLAAFKTALSTYPLTVLYALAEPVETPLTTEQIIALQSLQTYENVTNIYADAEVDVEYFKNNANGRVTGRLKAENNNLWQMLGNVNTVLESLIGGA